MNEKTIYFAGGCFWGVEHFFKGVDGVTSAVAGYANGNGYGDGGDASKAANGNGYGDGGDAGKAANGKDAGDAAGHGASGAGPSYEQVYTDKTGFAETVRVSYRPERIGLQELTRLYFATVDPLSLNQQGHDVGTRYRTGVYYTDPAERPLLEAVFAEQEAALGAKPVTELMPLRNFFPAEEYHQAYLDKNPEGYCHLPLKAFRYQRLYQDLKLLLGDEPDPIARMANTAAMIAERMKFFWVGFYRVAESAGAAAAPELVLGPFQGPTACFRIANGRGVCGTAWAQRRTLIVPDVEQFPGHIACSALSRSEIVVPVFENGSVTAVLDIDSTELGTFDRFDAAFLELIADIL